MNNALHVYGEISCIFSYHYIFRYKAGKKDITMSVIMQYRATLIELIVIPIVFPLC